MIDDKEMLKSLLGQLDSELNRLKEKINIYREHRRKRLYKTDILKLTANDATLLVPYYYEAPQAKKEALLQLLDEVYSKEEKDKFFAEIKNVYYLKQNNLTDIPQYAICVAVLEDFRERVKTAYANTSEGYLEREEEMLDSFEKTRAARRYFSAKAGSLVIEDIDKFIETIEVLNIDKEAKSYAIRRAFINNNMVYMQDFKRQEEEKRPKRKPEKIVAVKVIDDEEESSKEYQELFKEAKRLEALDKISIDKGYVLDETAQETFKLAEDFYQSNFNYFKNMTNGRLLNISGQTIDINSNYWQDLEGLFSKVKKEEEMLILVAQVGRMLDELQKITPENYKVDDYNKLINLYVDRLISLFDFITELLNRREIFYLSDGKRPYLVENIMKDILPSHYKNLDEVIGLLGKKNEVNKTTLMEDIVVSTFKYIKIYYLIDEKYILIIGAYEDDDKFADSEVKRIILKEKENILRFREEVKTKEGFYRAVNNNLEAKKMIKNALSGKDLAKK